MPLRVTPEQYAEKQSRRLKAALADMEAGIQRVSVAPTAQAADRVQKWQQRLQESSAKWQRNTRAVTLEQWKDATISKGINRVSGGIDAAQPKVIAMASRLLPAVEAARNQARAMPDLTLSDSIARMTKFVTEMSKFSK
jgi:hypothetical protein